MRNIFDETKINGMQLQNRLVRSATWEGMCSEDGRPTEKMANYLGRLAKGGAGLLISGYAYIRPDGKQMAGQMGIYSDDFSGDLGLATSAVHREGGKLCLQLVHCGGQTTSRAAGSQPVAPSAIAVAQYPEMPIALTIDDINEMASLFATAAKRAKDAGCDAVQLHAAHGYLINQFLSPLTNRRTDQYGGSCENRCRFLLDVYGEVRKEVGSSFPVMVKLNGSDNLEGGLSLEDAVFAAKRLDDAGVDAIEVSGGTPASGGASPVRQGINTPAEEGYNLLMADRIRQSVKCPVIVVGGLRSYEVVAGIIRRQEADYVAMSRPFIREPDLALRWQQGDEAPARCISCNGCFKPGLKEGGIYCVVDRIEDENRNSAL